jgi:hypothetical protein
MLGLPRPGERGERADHVARFRSGLYASAPAIGVVEVQLSASAPIETVRVFRPARLSGLTPSNE